MKKTALFMLILFVVAVLSGCGGEPKRDEPPSNGVRILISVGGEEFFATLADNPAAKAFEESLPLSLDMKEMNGNEKYFYLDEPLPANSYRTKKVYQGDLMLYGANCLVLFYESFSTSYSYTRIGWVNEPEALTYAVGQSNVTVTFEKIDFLPIAPDESGSETLPDKEDEKDVITKMYIYINDNRLEIALLKNSSVAALTKILKQSDIIYTANDYGNFEKVGNIGHSLPVNDAYTKAEFGDVILYGGTNIVLFYGSNSWSYTRIGKIKGYSASELSTLLCAGQGSSEVRLSLS